MAAFNQDCRVVDKLVSESAHNRTERQPNHIKETLTVPMMRILVVWSDHHGDSERLGSSRYVNNHDAGARENSVTGVICKLE